LQDVKTAVIDDDGKAIAMRLERCGRDVTKRTDSWVRLCKVFETLLAFFAAAIVFASSKP
jgi:hypothetical protein